MNKRNIYVIGVSHPTDGFAAIVKHTLSHIVFAINNNFIPIVDLKHYKNPYFKMSREYKDNVWEYFFEQPMGVTLSDITENDDVFLSNNTLCPNRNFAFPVSQLPTYPNKWQFGESKLILDYKKYLKFNPEIISYLNEEYEKIIGKEQNILGILSRGTDYFSLKPYCHPIQPTPEMIIKKAKQLQKELNYKKIYLATEDANIYNKFCSEFGNIIIPNKQFKYKYIQDKMYLTQIKIDRENHHYNLAKEYLLSLYILSKCKYLIGGRTSGMSLVYLMTNGFEYEFLWSLGYYDMSYKIKEKFLKFTNFLRK